VTGPGVSNRRAARERALELLYEAETKDVTPGELLPGLPVDPDPFAVDLVEGVTKHGERIDGFISQYARDWKLERMPAVDRAVLRLAIFELAERPDVPKGVVISEAVALAKRFSTEESGRFVNGLLARIADELRPGEAKPAG
jgi:transcription antitermination protein NusB